MGLRNGETNSMASNIENDKGTENEGKYGREKTLKVMLICLLANLACVSPGMTLGFSAVALPALMNSTDENVRLDDSQASWMASISSIATAVGCLFSGSIMDRFGRKISILSVNVPALIGWIIIAVAQGPGARIMIFIGRIFTGLSIGMCSSPPAVYSAEISSDKLRSIVVTLASLSISLGILIIFALGYIIGNDWRLIAGLSAGPPLIVFILGLIFIPESPVWLATKGHHDEASKLANAHFGYYKENVNSKMEHKPQTLRTIFKELGKSTCLRPLIIMNAFFAFQQFSGTFVVIFYAVDMIKEAGTPMDPYLVAVIIGAARFLFTILVSIISKYYGRRPLAIVSGAGMTLCMGGLATYVYFDTTTTIAQSLGWLPVTLLISYILASTIGFLTLPWAMVGEVFPEKVRGLAAGLSTCMAYLYNFLIIKMYLTLVFYLTRYGIFFFFGALSLIGTIFVFIFLPETRNKSFAEIEMQYKKKNKLKDVLAEEGKPLNKPQKQNSISTLPTR